MRNDARTMLRFALAVDVRGLMLKRRNEVAAMLESCGVSPSDVPLSTSMWREGRVVHLERYVRSRETGGILMSDERTGPAVEDLCVMPDHIPNWIPLG